MNTHTRTVKFTKLRRLLQEHIRNVRWHEFRGAYDITTAKEITEFYRKSKGKLLREIRSIERDMGAAIDELRKLTT